MKRSATSSRTLVTGAGGFIGGHLVRYLQELGVEDIVAVDYKPLDDWYQAHADVDSKTLDLHALDACREAVAGCGTVYNLAADMGGMGFIENNKALCMLSSLINTHLLVASREEGVERFFFASSACVYNAEKRRLPTILDSWRTTPIRQCRRTGTAGRSCSVNACAGISPRTSGSSLASRGITTSTARTAHGTADAKSSSGHLPEGDRAKLSGTNEIRIWGDGEQTRSFMYIDDCLFGTTSIMESSIDYLINLGSSEMVTINELVDVVEKIAGRAGTAYELDAPKGVRGRSSDNTAILKELDWEPRSSRRRSREDVCLDLRSDDCTRSGARLVDADCAQAHAHRRPRLRRTPVPGPLSRSSPGAVTRFSTSTAPRSRLRADHWR